MPLTIARRLPESLVSLKRRREFEGTHHSCPSSGDENMGVEYTHNKALCMHFRCFGWILSTRIAASNERLCDWAFCSNINQIRYFLICDYNGYTGFNGYLLHGLHFTTNISKKFPYGRIVPRLHNTA